MMDGVVWGFKNAQNAIDVESLFIFCIFNCSSE